MLEAVRDSVQDIGGMLGLASEGIAWASICCIVAALLCACYGLIHWNRGGERSRNRRGTKGKRLPRRR